MASGHRWNSVGDAFVRHLTAAYAEDGAVHWPTLIAATGALCGEAALMANESRIPEFGVIESRKVAELVHEDKITSRTLWGYSTTIAREAFGVAEDDLPSYRDVVELLGTNLLPGSFPALSVPAHLMPRETPMNAGPRHRKALHAIAGEAGVTTNDSAFALATAAMKMVGEAQALGARDLTVLALQSGVAGSRFVPLYDPVANPGWGRIGGDAPETEEEAPIPAAAVVAAALTKSRGDSGFGKRR